MFKKDYTSRLRRKARVRKKIFGTADRPRISVYRSLNHIYAQLIDDTNDKTLLSVSTLSADIKDDVKKTKLKTEKSKLVGKLLAKKAVELGIKSAVFDRNGFDYHGRVKAVADAVREGGIKV